MTSSVLFVLPGFPRRPGGGHKVVYQYANALVERGHRVAVLHAWTDRAGRRKLIFNRDTLVRSWYLLFRRRRPEWFHLDSRVEVSNLPRQDIRMAAGFEVVVATSVRTAVEVYERASALDARAVYLIQHYEDFSAEPSYVDMTWRLPMVRVVVSAWLQEIGASLGVETVLVPNGVDTREFPRGRPIRDRKRMVLALISEQPWKRMDLAIAVLNGIHVSHRDVRLVGFGVGPRPDTLPSYVEYHENPSRGVLSELYRSAWVYLCTSDFEGYGLPVAEALASGSACVSTRNGGVESFAGESIPFVVAGDARGMFEVVNSLLLDADECQRVASAGWSEISAMTVDVSASRLEHVLFGGHDGAEVIGGSGQGEPPHSTLRE